MSKNILIIHSDLYLFIIEYRGCSVKYVFLNFKLFLASEVRERQGGGVSFTLSSLAHGRPEKRGKKKRKRKSGVCRTLLQVTCSSSVVVMACCLSCMNYVSSATKVFHNYLCAQRLWRMRQAFLRVCLDFLRVSLARPDGPAEAGSPPPSTGDQTPWLM